MLKRIFDLLFSFFGMIVLSPLFLISAILIKLDSPGPVFFRQDRVGKGGKIFKIWKFRTMIQNAQSLGVNFTTPSNDGRITRSGRFLRRFCIDEFPQLINIFLGEMSVVGPRPEVPEIVALYNEQQKKILSVSPGMTSVATEEYLDEGKIMGSSTDLYQDYIKNVFPKKIEIDLKYIKSRSLWLDVKIILKTFFKIVY